MCISLHGTKEQCTLIHAGKRRKTQSYTLALNTEMHENNTEFKYKGEQ